MPDDDLWKKVKNIVRKYQKGDKNIQTDAYYCVSRNLTRREAISKLTKIMSKTKAEEFVNILYDNISKLQKRKESEKNVTQKKMKKTDFKFSPSKEPGKVIQSSNINSNKYEIEESEKSKQVNFLHQKIQESLARHGLLQQKTLKKGFIDPNMSKREVLMNEYGKTVDAKTGQLITLVQHTPTAKINLRAKRKTIARIARLELKSTQIKPEVVVKEDKSHFDSRIKDQNSLRKPRSIVFIEPGKISQAAQTERTRLQFEKLQSKIQEIATRTGIASATKLAMVTLKEEAYAFSRTSDIEWWDQAILGTQNYQNFNKIRDIISLESIETEQKSQEILSNFFIGITNLVEHPVPRLPPGEAKKDSALKIFLTKVEQRKIRTRRRIENEKEKQEKIILGLMPPPPPKVKMSNLMRVLGTEAVQDPTKVETYVRNQIAARKTAHEQINAARKLTPEQKTAKLIKKYTEDTSLGVHVSVYRVWDLTGRSKRFKIEQNAQQNHMTGCIIIHHHMNLVILEGGPKSQKRMRRLMLNRIKWSEDKITFKGNQSDIINTTENKCVLVWEGVNGYHNFKKWTFKSIETEALILEFLKKHQSDQFWNLACSFTLDS